MNNDVKVKHMNILQKNLALLLQENPQMSSGLRDILETIIFRLHMQSILDHEAIEVLEKIFTLNSISLLIKE